MTDNMINPRRINKDLPIPYYYQIVQVLRESIDDIKGDENEDEIQLPSEAELCEIFSVNRGTIRHALDLLEREGLIYRERGRGAFIRRRRVELDLSFLNSTTEDLKSRGWIPRTEVLSIKQVDPRSHIRNILNMKEGEKAWEVLRRRWANEEPISLQQAFFPENLTPNLISQDLTKSFFEIWKNKYGLHPKDAEQTIRTRAATQEEAEKLSIVEGAPIFEITRVTFDINNVAFEYLQSVWRGDRYDFKIHLRSR
jgi:GntR family transcriptional regulator